MIKKQVPVILLIAMFIVASCSASPQKRYATEMKQAVDLLAKSQADYAKLESLLTGPATSTSNITRLEIIDLYNLAAGYKITRADYLNLGFGPLDDLISPSIKFSKDGHTILDILSKVIPIEETQSDHQIVLKCVQTRVAFAEELSSAIKNLSPIDMSKAGDLSNCEKFDSSLQTLTTFINEHK